MEVKKRNGNIEEFNIDTIQKVIMKAAKASKHSIENNVMLNLLNFIKTEVEKFDGIIDVENIQTIVENALMNENLFDIERCFHDYRVEHDKIRFKSFQIAKEMEEKLAASNIQNSNANMDEASFGGRKGEMINSYLKDEALKYRINPKFSKLHETNHIYEHDLDSWSLGCHNCLSIPFDDLLKYGVKTRQADIRPAGSLNTAFQLIAVYFQLQSLQQFGGVSATHIDWTLVPYFRKSFFKHFKDGLKYIEQKSDKKVEKIIDDLKK